MKIWAISDTHTYHNILPVPEVDMVIFCGDATISIDSNKNPNVFFSSKELFHFCEWFFDLPIKYKVFVPGNHDLACQRPSMGFEQLFTENGCIYLQHDYTEVEGLRIFGSPYTHIFSAAKWAFKAAKHKMNKYWNQIPDDLDILITHGPPFATLSYTDDKETGKIVDAGCKHLYTRVNEIKPRFHFFGHIHNGESKQGPILNYGNLTRNGTNFYNCSVVTDRKFGEVTNHGHIINIG